MILNRPSPNCNNFAWDCTNFSRSRPDTLPGFAGCPVGTPNVRSVVELSSSPLFRREYSSITDAITSSFRLARRTKPSDRPEPRLGAPHRALCAAPLRRRFLVVGTDVVPVSRPFARTLADRSFVYQPNPVRGATTGDRWAPILRSGLLPEQDTPMTRRGSCRSTCAGVQSREKARAVGAEQLRNPVGRRYATVP